MSPLDNPVWSALTGPHTAFAIGRGAARHYPRQVAPFFATTLWILWRRPAAR